MIFLQKIKKKSVYRSLTIIQLKQKIRAKISLLYIFVLAIDQIGGIFWVRSKMLKGENYKKLLQYMKHFIYFPALENYVLFKKSYYILSCHIHVWGD